MNKKDFKKLQEQQIESLKKWKEAGNEIGEYLCNHCLKEIPCRIPNKKMVGSKGYWDSATICTNCGNLNFVKEYPNGTTTSMRM